MEDKLPPILQTLSDAIEQKGMKITFGIQAKHLEIIEEERLRMNSVDLPNIPKERWPDMIYSEYFWEVIGKKVGWLPFTICLHYFKHLSKQEKIKNTPEA
jgi:hypothetical protein